MSSTPSKVRGDRVTLPPIRDILGDELASSATSHHRHTTRSPAAAFSLRPLHSALSEDDGTRKRSHDSSYTRDNHHDNQFSYRVIDATSNSRSYSSSRPTTASSQYSSSYYKETGQVALHTRSFDQVQEYDSDDTQRRKVSSNVSVPPHKLAQRSQFHPYQDSSKTMANGNSPYQRIEAEYARPHLHPNDDRWGQHRRRDSTESSWSSSQSSSREASPQVQAFPKSGGLQFQPLPASHLSSHFGRLQAGTSPQAPSPDGQSPFGVLVADLGANGTPPSDPQRLAILRTLRASGSSITLAPAFEDFQNARANLATARYECPYCRKRFNRPSSLKIHINSHTGEKPFQCPYAECGRRFSVQSNMRRHMRVHTTPGLQIPDESSGDEESSQSTSTDTPSMSPQIRPTLAPLEVSYPKPPQEANESTPRPISSPRRSRSAQSLSYPAPTQSHNRATSGVSSQSSNWHKTPSSR